MRINPTQFRLIQEQAEKVLEEFIVKYGFPKIPPIPVELIAQNVFGLRFDLGDLMGSFGCHTLGALSTNNQTIYLDKTCHPHQYNFVVAHEIGHYVLHEGSHQIYIGEEIDRSLLRYKTSRAIYDNRSIKNEPLLTHIPFSQYLSMETSRADVNAINNPKETQANRFAAALLVPRTFLSSAVANYDLIDEKAVISLSRLFWVSREVVLYRIKDLNNHLEWKGPPIDRILFRDLKKRYQIKKGAHKSSFGRYCGSRPIAAPVFKKGSGTSPSHSLAHYLNERRKAQVLQWGQVTPFIIEFAGTPNAGKDKLIDITTDLLRDAYGAKVAVYKKEIVDIHEEIIHWDADGLYQKIASVCRWLIDVAITNTRNVDFAILNKGIFDALAFMKAYCKLTRNNKAKRITRDQEHVLSEYLVSERVAGLIDEIYVLLISPKEAIRRENENKRQHVISWAKWNGLDPERVKPQRILKARTLISLNATYREVYRNYYKIKHSRRFQSVNLLDFTKHDGITVAEETKRLARVFHIPPSSTLHSTMPGASARPHNRSTEEGASSKQLALF